MKREVKNKKFTREKSVFVELTEDTMSNVFTAESIREFNAVFC